MGMASTLSLLEPKLSPKSKHQSLEPLQVQTRMGR